MPFLLTHRLLFVADHFHDLPGFVEARHGHNWEVTATVQLDDEQGEPAFTRSLGAWVESVDYTLLNEQPWLAGRNPTAELLAQWAFEHLDAQGLHPVTIKVREKANYWALCGRGGRALPGGHAGVKGGTQSERQRAGGPPFQGQGPRA